MNYCYLISYHNLNIHFFFLATLYTSNSISYFNCVIDYFPCDNKYHGNSIKNLVFFNKRRLQTYVAEATPCFVRSKLFVLAFNIGLSDTAVMDMMVSTLQQQRAVTEQLRREASIKRIPVSVAVADIVRYINEHHQEDCLLVGFSSQKVNPFREKSSCTVL